MANNIKLFNTVADYEAAELVYPSVSYIVETDRVAYDDVEPTPTPSFKWKATYSDGNVTSAECDSSSAITQGEIEKTNLVSVEIGNCLTSIGDFAFSANTSITSVTIPNSVTSIGMSSFRGCSSLANLDIPNSVTSISAGAFDNTPWLNTYSADTSHHYGNIIYINDIAYKATSTGITSCTFREGTVSIGGEAFNKCKNLTSLDIPNSVTSIETLAFSSCSSLTSITIPDSVTSIGNGVFQMCKSLTSITIGSGVTSIGQYAFYQCSSLASLTCNATNPPTLGNNAFDFFSKCQIYVPSESVETYKTAWSSLASRIQAIQ